MTKINWIDSFVDRVRNCLWRKVCYVVSIETRFWTNLRLVAAKYGSTSQIISLCALRLIVSQLHTIVPLRRVGITSEGVPPFSKATACIYNVLV